LHIAATSVTDQAIGGGCGSVVECGLPKPEMRVRFPSPAPNLKTPIKSLEETLPQGFTVLSFPHAHQRRLRVSNDLERVNQELRRRIAHEESFII
jgi:hypothetical protein